MFRESRLIKKVSPGPVPLAISDSVQVVKLGGTAMTDILIKGLESQVLATINQLKADFQGKVVFVVSAPGKVYGHSDKITTRLLEAFELAVKTEDSLPEVDSLINAVKDDFVSMAVFNLTEEQGLIEVLLQIERMFAVLKNRFLEGTWARESLKDQAAAIGENVAALILAKMLNAECVNTSQFNVSGSDVINDGGIIYRPLGDVIAEHTLNIQVAVSRSVKDCLVISGFSGYTPRSGTIKITGRGYTDFTAVMATPDGGTLILCKDVSGIFSIDPKLLDDGRQLKIIGVIPIGQMVSLAKVIGDIQAIHPLALMEAERRGIKIEMLNEQDYTDCGTSIVSDSEYQKTSLERVPILAATEDRENFIVGVSGLKADRVEAVESLIKDDFVNAQFSRIEEAEGYQTLKVTLLKDRSSMAKSEILRKIFLLIDSEALEG